MEELKARIATAFAPLGKELKQASTYEADLLKLAYEKEVDSSIKTVIRDSIRNFTKLRDVIETVQYDILRYSTEMESLVSPPPCSRHRTIAPRRQRAPVRHQRLHPQFLAPRGAGCILSPRHYAMACLVFGGGGFYHLALRCATDPLDTLATGGFFQGEYGAMHSMSDDQPSLRHMSATCLFAFFRSLLPIRWIVQHGH